jgi:hypothetical protein
LSRARIILAGALSCFENGKKKRGQIDDRSSLQHGARGQVDLSAMPLAPSHDDPKRVRETFSCCVRSAFFPAAHDGAIHKVARYHLQVQCLLVVQVQVRPVSFPFFSRSGTRRALPLRKKRADRLVAREARAIDCCGIVHLNPTRSRDRRNGRPGRHHRPGNPAPVSPAHTSTRTLPYLLFLFRK